MSSALQWCGRVDDSMTLRCSYVFDRGQQHGETAGRQHEDQQISAESRRAVSDSSDW